MLGLPMAAVPIRMAASEALGHKPSPTFFSAPPSQLAWCRQGIVVKTNDFSVGTRGTPCSHPTLSLEESGCVVTYHAAVLLLTRLANRVESPHNKELVPGRPIGCPIPKQVSLRGTVPRSGPVHLLDQAPAGLAACIRMQHGRAPPIHTLMSSTTPEEAPYRYRLGSYCVFQLRGKS